MSQIIKKIACMCLKIVQLNYNDIFLSFLETGESEQHDTAGQQLSVVWAAKNSIKTVKSWGEWDKKKKGRESA